MLTGARRRLAAAQIAVSVGCANGTPGSGTWIGAIGGGINGFTAAGAACAHGWPAPRRPAVLDVRAGRQLLRARSGYELSWTPVFICR